MRFFSIFLCAAITLQAELSLAGDETTLAVMQRQTSVKTQDKVRACSIFAATGLLENKLIQLGYADPSVDLSEQWLVFVTAGQKGVYGVRSADNIRAYRAYGFVQEALWKFNPTPWSTTDEISLFTAPQNFFRRNNVCGHLKKSELLNNCYIGQRDPRLLAASDAELLQRGGELFDSQFYTIRENAKAHKNAYAIAGLIHSSKKAILNLLDRGEALLLDVNFFYEAWSHRKAPEYGLERNMEFWNQGIVSYPDRSSKDYNSKRAGHSVIIVGYDAQRVIERTVKDINGNDLVVKSVGVYYFKNSWGPDGFGKNFTFMGQRFPGFGMIPMQYAHEHGSFVQMTVNGK